MRNPLTRAKTLKRSVKLPIELPIVPAADSAGTITAGQDGGALLRRSVLPGGVRVITEKIPGMRSASIGAWVGAGSRDEPGGSHGASHYLEHLLFKGTSKRSAHEIAQIFDAAGGEANAVTGKEHTCYYARILDEDVPLALDVICDMIVDPLLDAQEFERERGVILEEISMHSDDPADVVFENFTAALYPGHALGRPIAGTIAEIQELEREAVVDYYRAHYSSKSLVIAAAGGVDHDQICDQVTQILSGANWLADQSATPLARRSELLNGALADPAPHTQYRPGQQANIVVGSRGLNSNDPDRYALALLHAIYGGGMSSRLFQQIREIRGLAYSVHSFSSGYADTGMFGVYAGCAVENAGQVIDLIDQQWRELLADGVTEAELSAAAGQARGGLVLGLEDSGARMSRLGRAELTHGEILSVDEMIERINAVTQEDIARVAKILNDQSQIQVALGPFENGIS